MSHKGAPGRFAVDEIENAWIPMSDGLRLAARIWLPRDIAPVPAILEYIPYRKRDFTRLSDDEIHPVLASHGYTGLRVDVRCSGDSDSLPQHQYVTQERDDSVDVISWLAAQESTAIVVSIRSSETKTVSDSDPARTQFRAQRSIGFERGPWQPRIAFLLDVTPTPALVRLHGEARACDGCEEVAARSWAIDVPARSRLMPPRSGNQPASTLGATHVGSRNLVDRAPDPTRASLLGPAPFRVAQPSAQPQRRPL